MGCESSQPVASPTSPAESKAPQKPLPKVGDILPDVKLFRGTHQNMEDLRGYFRGKKGLLIGIPGAFSPGCSKMLPGYLEQFEEIRAAGAEVIVVVSVNDPYVMAAFSDHIGAEGKITIMSDMMLQMTNELGTQFQTPAGVRSRRYSMVVVDNVIKGINMEEGLGLTVSAAEPTLELLKSVS